jgi:hypothetical protein
MDVTGIDPGRDFRKAIDGAVGSCDVLIVMIGKKWVDSTDDRGRRRLDDPEDFVRMETAAALRRDIPVIPVLVQGSGMPGADQLPGELQALAWRNAFEVRHARWEIDTKELVKALKKVVGGALGTDRTPQAVEDKHSKLWGRKPVVALALGAVAVLLGLAVYFLRPGGGPQVSSGTRSNVSARMGEMEYGTNRLGGDYRSFEAADPQACRDNCAGEAQCLAFTFVKPGVQKAAGVCWLKDRVSPPNPDANCVSGIKS